MTAPSAPLETTETFWAQEPEVVLGHLHTSASGLTSAEAKVRLERVGTLAGQRGHGVLPLLFRQFTSPIILILIVATLISLGLGDTIDATIILAIIVVSGLLGFYQERGALRAVEALLATVQVHCEVRRDGLVHSVAFEEVVPGDIVELNAGDVIPGDCRVLVATICSWISPLSPGRASRSRKQMGFCHPTHRSRIEATVCSWEHMSPAGPVSPS